MPRYGTIANCYLCGMRIGIVMGGPSREREVSFAGGRTVYDNLDKQLFSPVALLVDTRGRFVQLDWPLLYKGTLRDFFPPAHATPPGPFQPYADQLEGLSDDAYDTLLAEIGTPVPLETLPNLIDAAFLTLHGAFGEDGAVQGLFQWLGTPYTGTGLYASALGLDKRLQRAQLPKLGFPSPQSLVVPWAELAQSTEAALSRIQRLIGLPCVIKHPTQGSSIGVKIVEDPQELFSACTAVAFRYTALPAWWQGLSEGARTQWLQQRCDPRVGLALPLLADGTLLRSPEALRGYLDSATAPVSLASLDAPHELLVEQFIPGTEFSCIVVEDPQGTPIALPPTEILKRSKLYDYRAKYLPGQANKRTPIQLPDSQVEQICREAERLFSALHCQVYARLDGILHTDGTVFFNDPNTTSGMLPGSFFFHQAAEVGLAPGELLTYILLRSLQVRVAEGVFGTRAEHAYRQLTKRLEARQKAHEKQTRVGVFLGGYSAERHVAVESGRNVVEKLAASPSYQPLPIFVLANHHLPEPYRNSKGITGEFSFWELPTRMLLKDNADDIAHGIVTHVTSPGTNPVVAAIREKARTLTGPLGVAPVFEPRLLPITALAQNLDMVLNTVHGRPGEDGQLQELFLAAGLPFNGAMPIALQRTQDKAATNAFLAQQGVRVPRHLVVQPGQATPEQLAAAGLSFPIIAKPIDEGCSSAVKRLETPEQLAAYANLTFRTTPAWSPDDAASLHLLSGEEFPQKPAFLVEELIASDETARVVEVTVGFVTHRQVDGSLRYEVFEPSETRAENAILSLEEKFLAGEGQNITPARLSDDPDLQQQAIELVQRETEHIARLLALEGYSRFDGFVRIPAHGNPEFIFLEANTLPALTPATVLFHQAARAGYTPLALLEHLLQQGQLRHAAQTTPV